MKCRGKGILFPLENRKKSRTFFRTEKVSSVLKKKKLRHFILSETNPSCLGTSEIFQATAKNLRIVVIP